MSTPYTPQTLARIAELRAKSMDGSITMEEMQEGVRLMRQDRMSAASASTTARRAKAKAEIPSADDMLAELGGI